MTGAKYFVCGNLIKSDTLVVLQVLRIILSAMVNLFD